MNAITPFIGAILIVFGGIMTFAGAKFLFLVFAGLVGLLVTAVLFLTCYNFFLDPSKSGMGALIGLLVFTTLVGGAVGYFAYKFGKAWAVSVLAAWAGIAIGVTLVKLLGIKGTKAPVVAAMLGAASGFYFGKKFNRFIRSVGTALIGSFLLVRGIGAYAGNYPSETNFVNDVKDGGSLTYNKAIIGYFGGMVVLTIAGSLVQLRLFRDEETDKEDMFAGEDEGRKCGCF